MYDDLPPIQFVQFAIFDGTGMCKAAFERHVPSDISGAIIPGSIEEVIEDMLDAREIEYEILSAPIYDKHSKIWITHNLYGDHAGCIVGFFNIT
jgi:hypothetical protein